MTAIASCTGRRRLGALAVALSLLLHAGLLALLWLAPSRSTSREVGNMIIDQSVRDDVAEVRLVLVDVPVPSKLPTPASLKRSVGQDVPSQLPQAIPPPPGPPAHSSEASHSQVLSSVTHHVSPAGRAAGQGGVTTAFFEVPAQGQRIVYAIDRSASMGPQQLLARAKRELLASLEQLGPDVQFQIILYNRVCVVLPIGGRSGLAPATPENRRRAAALLEAVHAEGGTDHVAALRQALSLGPDVVYFLTDAAELKPDQVRAVTRLNRGRSIIHVIELRKSAADSPLRTLAQENRGEYRLVE
jgi:hypothetical protein